MIEMFKKINDALSAAMKAKDAVRLNVAAVALSVYIGTGHEHQTLLNLAKLVDDGEKYGIPVLAVTAVGKEMEKREARYLGLCCRIAAELGARVVKTYWCEKDFDKVVRGCQVPVVMAGGPKCETDLEVLEFVADGMQKGAVGINLGRKVWQNPNPVPMAKALNAIVHKNLNAKEAFAVFNETKHGSKPRKK